MYYLGCTSDKIWDYPGLVQHLSKMQDKDLIIKLEPEAICLHNLGLYDLIDSFQFRSVTIYTNNPLEKHTRYTIVHDPVDLWTCNRPTVDITEYHIWNKSKLFMCLYGRPTAGRLGIGSYIAAHYPNHAHIHYSFPVDGREYEFELDKLLEYRVDSIAEASKLLPAMPIKLESTERYSAFNGYDYKDSLTRYYQDILIDLVVESHVAGKTFFPTEKTFRAMWLKKPFIIFASKDYLCYLRQMGFRTFHDFWDEEYDGYEGRDRLRLILELIDKIAGMDKGTLEDMYLSMQYTLDHNYNLLKSNSLTTEIVEVE